MQDFVSSLPGIFSPIQLLAWGAAVLYVISYQKQSAEKTIVYWIPADLLMTLHFFFLGAPFFMATALAGMVRSILALKAPYRVLAIFICTYTAVMGATLYLFDFGAQEYFAFAGTLFFSASVLSKKYFLVHRAFALGHQISWIIAFTMLGSYGGLALILFLLASNIIGTGRYLYNRSRQPSKSKMPEG